MNALKALILDFDGVILESNHLKTAAFEAVFARYPKHAAAMMAYHRAHFSDSRFSKFQYFVTTYLGLAADDPLVAELGVAFSAEMLMQIDGCVMVPGAQELLERASAAVPVYLASVTPQPELDAILRRRQLDGFFAGVYGCPPWTKPAAIREILVSCGGVDGVLFIGDSVGDQRAARETGVAFLARDSGLPFEPPAPTTFPDLWALGAAIASGLSAPAKGLPRLT